jgi:hypothetical protein
MLHYTYIAYLVICHRGAGYWPPYEVTAGKKGECQCVEYRPFWDINSILRTKEVIDTVQLLCPQELCDLPPYLRSTRVIPPLCIDTSSSSPVCLSVRPLHLFRFHSLFIFSGLSIFIHHLTLSGHPAFPCNYHVAYRLAFDTLSVDY